MESLPDNVVITSLLKENCCAVIDIQNDGIKELHEANIMLATINPHVKHISV